MTTHKHTPGPWDYDRDTTANTLTLLGPDSAELPCSDANCQLVASAPELLAALEAAVRVLENECPDWGGVKLGRAAIAKATGGEGTV